MLKSIVACTVVLMLTFAGAANAQDNSLGPNSRHLVMTALTGRVVVFNTAFLTTPSPKPWVYAVSNHGTACTGMTASGWRAINGVPVRVFPIGGAAVDTCVVWPPNRTLPVHMQVDWIYFKDLDSGGVVDIVWYQ